MFYITIVNKLLRHCHSWLARQYMCHIHLCVHSGKHAIYHCIKTRDEKIIFFFALQEIMHDDNALLQLPKLNALVNNYNNSK